MCFYCGKSHNIKHAILTIVNGTVQWHFSTVVQILPSSVSPDFHLPKLKLCSH